MNTFPWPLKYKLHHKPFNTACCGIYPKNLDGIPLILILIENDPPTPLHTDFSLGLARCYFWLVAGNS